MNETTRTQHRIEEIGTLNKRRRCNRYALHPLDLWAAVLSAPTDPQRVALEAGSNRGYTPISACIAVWRETAEIIRVIGIYGCVGGHRPYGGTVYRDPRNQRYGVEVDERLPVTDVLTYLNRHAPLPAPGRGWRWSCDDLGLVLLGPSGMSWHPDRIPTHQYLATLKTFAREQAARAKLEKKALPRERTLAKKLARLVPITMEKLVRISTLAGNCPQGTNAWLARNCSSLTPEAVAKAIIANASDARVRAAVAKL